MSDPSKETPIPPLKEVRLDEWFDLFVNPQVGGNSVTWHPYVVIDGEVLILKTPSHNFAVEPHVGEPPRKFDARTEHAFVPFQRAVGSTVLPEGLKKGKIDTKIVDDNFTVFRESPLYFYVMLSHGDNKQGISQEQLKELEDEVRTLHLQVSFPEHGGEFESKIRNIEAGDVDSGGLVVTSSEFFYPRRGGPIAAGGIPIFLPNDPNKLMQTRAKFVKHPPFPSVQPLQR